MRTADEKPDADGARATSAEALVRAPDAVIELTGTGALACLQGIVSNDVVKPGDNSLTYAGILTPKGLLISDAWIVRAAGRLFLVAPAESRAVVLEVFRRSLPPRLAQAVDLTSASQVLWTWQATHGSTARVRVVDDVVVARREPPPWFDEIVFGPAEAIDRVLATRLAGGGVERDGQWAEARRITAGWPRLGREIDEKTLVQEVRFDENGGVSYDKGCYTGQETVARLHFRGHTNRNLRGLAWAGEVAVTDDRVLLDGKEVGRVGSSLEMPGRRVGLALIRREVDDGALVVAGGSPATVVALPFEEAPSR
jgi:folate-binding protein YgfZ